MNWTELPDANKDAIEVDGGRIVGTARQRADGARIKAWLGIPYAAPPLGGLRFKPPQPVVPWSRIRRADRLGPQCVQPGRREDSLYAEYSGVQAMSEDCLTLNVWSAGELDDRLPVMVWIHGGGHRQGAGSNPVFTEGDLPLRGVVLVTINYRLGPLGFLCHPDLAAESPQGTSGNYALMDQVAALAWVKRNIARFGGDPDCVTIFGQSAGGEAVGMLLATPAARGLFHRAIVMSLGATRPMVTAAERAKAGPAWATKLGANSLADLRAMPAADLLKADYPAGMVVDGYMMPESGWDALAAGRQADVPLLVGWTADDGSVFPPPVTPEGFAAKMAETFGARAPEVMALYPSATPEQAIRSNQDVFREQVFAWPAWSTARLHAGKAPAYLYQFRHKQPFRPEQSFVEASPASAAGAFHSSDYPYVFGTLDVLDRDWQPADRALSRRMQQRWTAFAYSGNPNAAGLMDWPAGADRVLAIAAEDVVAPLPDADRLAFFESWFAGLR